jgi:uncharacterized OB-fold protein
VPETSEFWDGLERGAFLLQTCADCGHVRFPPTAMCRVCLSVDARWQAASGGGEVWSVTRVERPPSPDWQGEVPYWLVVVQLDEGAKVLGRLRGVSSDHGVEIGLRVNFAIGDPGDGEGRTRYWFTP